MDPEGFPIFSVNGAQNVESPKTVAPKKNLRKVVAKLQLQLHTSDAEVVENWRQKRSLQNTAIPCEPWKKSTKRVKLGGDDVTCPSFYMRIISLFHLGDDNPTQLYGDYTQTLRGSFLNQPSYRLNRGWRYLPSYVEDDFIKHEIRIPIKPTGKFWWKVSVSVFVFCGSCEDEGWFLFDQICSTRWWFY